MWQWQKCNSVLHFCISQYVSFEVAATWRAKRNRALSITATAYSSNSLYSSDLNGVSNCWVLIFPISAMVFVRRLIVLQRVVIVAQVGRQFCHRWWHNSPFYNFGHKGTIFFWYMQILQNNSCKIYKKYRIKGRKQLIWEIIWRKKIALFRPKSHFFLAYLGNYM